MKPTDEPKEPMTVEEYKKQQFYSSFFYLGRRPTLDWILVIAIALVYPVQLLVHMIPFLDVYSIDTEYLTSTGQALLAIAGVATGARSYEKVKLKDDVK